ncbi:MAG: photosynthetic complex putative assembly protein PuhB [Ideonella sp.]|nr:photosynthetic complex putative assembly protein PuhB [Ideonella sp.]
MRAVNFVSPEHEHEFEAVHGLPEALPAHEALLWQGRPDSWRLACEALHIRAVALYFAVLIGWRLVSMSYDGESSQALLMALIRMGSLASLGLGLMGALAVLMARSTVYTLTKRRIVMRVGIVLSISFNLPLSRIAGVNLRSSDGVRGDIALSLAGPDRIAYLHLWPHARAWQLRQPQPLLRCLPDAAQVAQQLVGLLAEEQRAHKPLVKVPAPGLPQRAVLHTTLSPIH